MWPPNQLDNDEYDLENLLCTLYMKGTSWYEASILHQATIQNVPNLSFNPSCIYSYKHMDTNMKNMRMWNYKAQDTIIPNTPKP